MKKLLLLTRALRKTGSGKSEKAGKLVGDNTVPLYILFGIVLITGCFFAGRYLAASRLADLLGLPVIIRTLLFCISILLLFKSFIDLIGSLYMSSDLPVLLALPFSPRQIVLARTINCCLPKFLITGAVLIPFGVGYAIAAAALPVNFWPALILSVFCIPLYSVAAAAILVIVIMAVFRFFRNRNLLTVIGGILLVAVSAGAGLITNGDTTLNAETTNQIITDLTHVTAGISSVFPVVSLLADSIGAGHPWFLTASIGITLLALLVFSLVMDKLYLKGALSMQDTSAKRAVLHPDILEKRCRKHKVRTACMIRDLRMIFRNPAYMANGWLITLIWPVLIVIPLLMNSFGQMEFSFDPAHPSTMLGLTVGLSLISSSVSSCMTCLPHTLLDREGESWYYLKMLPVPYREQILGKRNAAYAICAIGGVLYPLIGGILLICIGMLDLPWLMYLILLSAVITLLLVNTQAVLGLRRPNLNWESESSIAKTSLFGLIVFLVFLVLGMVLAFLSPVLIVLLDVFSLPEGILSWMAALAVLLVFSLLAFLTDKRLQKSAEAKLSEL